MRLRWAAPVALAAMVALLASCSSSTSTLNPSPSITAVFPDTQTAGDPDFTLNIIGTNFLTTSQVFWNGSCVPAPGSCATNLFNVSTQQLTITIPAIDIATAGSPQITVVNPPGVNGKTCGTSG